jgi:AcrR family transcriptional regulator
LQYTEARFRLSSTVSRPLRADARRNRERVLVAARQTFAADGLDAQVDDIASRAGVGVGTVYRHFPTKEALLEAIANEGYEEICRIASESLEIEDPWEAFSEFMWRGARLHRDDRAQCELNTIRPDVVRKVAGDKRELFGFVAQLIERAQRAGVMRANITADDMPMIWCTIGAAQQQSGGDRWERYLELILDGLRAH